MTLLDLFVYTEDSTKVTIRNGSDFPDDLIYTGDFIFFPVEYKSWHVDNISIEKNHMVIDIYN